MRKLVILAVGSLLLADLSGGLLPQPAVAGVRDRAHAEFQQLWNARLESYRNKRTELEGRTKESASDLVSKPFNPADGRLQTFIDARLSLGEIHGRGALLTDFVTHMRSRPSIGLTRAWLQGQFDVLRSSGAADKSFQRMKALEARSDITVGAYLVAVEAAASQRGEATGRAQELILLVDNFGAYSEELAQADSRDRENRARFAAALQGFAQGLQANRGWTAQCSVMGSFVNCSGN